MAIIYNPHKKKGFIRIPSGATQAVSCAFSYSASSYTTSDPDPTPTITGDSGGVFTSTAGIVINSATGEITLASSSIASYVITYTVRGKACQQTVEIASGFDNDYCLEFDGVNDYLICGNDSSLVNLGTGSTFSVSLWFKPAASAFTSWGRTLASMSDGGAGAGWIIRFDNAAATPTKLMMEKAWGVTSLEFPLSGTHGSYTWDITATPYVWWNLVVRWDEALGASGEGTFYLNGNDVTGSLTCDLTNYSGAVPDFLIGSEHAWTPPATDHYWSGNIDEVAYWNKYLTDADITAIYNSGTPGDLSSHASVANLKAWWRMGDNAPAYATSDPQWLLIENSNTV